MNSRTTTNKVPGGSASVEKINSPPVSAQQPQISGGWPWKTKPAPCQSDLFLWAMNNRGPLKGEITG